MAEPALELSKEQSESGQHSVVVGDKRVESVSALNVLGLDLTDPDRLRLYVEAANHLSHGFDYRVIDDADAYRTGYEARYAAEDPNAEWQQGAPRLHDFGHSDLSLLGAPLVAGDHVVAFVEDDFLRVPYRATFPLAGSGADEAVNYEPLPVLAED